MSHPLGAGAGGPAGAHPLNDDEHRRRGGWWWWLIALLAVLLAALIIVLLARHFNGNDTNTAARKTVPTVTTSAPSSLPATPESTSTSPDPTSPAPSGTTSSAPVAPVALCEPPSLTATPGIVHADQRVTVVGRHFSGCHAVTGNAVPTATLAVSIRVTGSSAVTKALATSRTDAKGDFTVTLTLPASTGKRVTLLAASRDVKTTRAYAGAATIAYTSSTVGGGGRPTAVPAGTGGAAASTSNADVETQLALLAGGLLLAAGGTTALLRRRRTAR